jgi:hypothetical protein
MARDLVLTVLATQSPCTTITLYSCNRDSPPTYADHPDVEEVGEIKMTFSTDDISQASSRQSAKAGCLVRQFSYMLTMKPDEGQLVFKVIMAGSERGSAIITFK